MKNYRKESITFRGNSFGNLSQEEIGNLLAKYADYKPIDMKNIEFFEPTDESQISFVNKKKNEKIRFCLFILVVFLLCFIWAIVCQPLKIVILTGIPFLVAIYAFVTVLKVKPMITVGTVVSKMSHGQTGKGNWEYFFTVAFDNKTICHHIRTYARYFADATEGTKVLVVKIGTGVYAYGL